MSATKRLANIFRKETARPKPRKRPSPLSIRISDEERAQLKEAAGSRPVNAYVRERLFASDKKRHRKAPVEDYEALARALSMLGRSDITTRLSALLIAIEQQKLNVTDEVERDVRNACSSIKAIRNDLIIALGLKA